MQHPTLHRCIHIQRVHKEGAHAYTHTHTQLVLSHAPHVNIMTCLAISELYRFYHHVHVLSRRIPTCCCPGSDSSRARAQTQDVVSVTKKQGLTLKRFCASYCLLRIHVLRITRLLLQCCSNNTNGFSHMRHAIVPPFVQPSNLMPAWTDLFLKPWTYLWLSVECTFSMPLRFGLISVTQELPILLWCESTCLSRNNSPICFVTFHCCLHALTQHIFSLAPCPSFCSWSDRCRESQKNICLIVNVRSCGKIRNCKITCWQGLTRLGVGIHWATHLSPIAECIILNDFAEVGHFCAIG